MCDPVVLKEKVKAVADLGVWRGGQSKSPQNAMDPKDFFTEYGEANRYAIKVR